MIALDSNILIYAEGINDRARQALALGAIAALDANTVSVPVQALGELFAVLVRKGGRSPQEAGAVVNEWEVTLGSFPTTATALCAAIELAGDHRLQIWDAIMLAVAGEHGCACLLSEDLQDGFQWRGVEVINPLSENGLARALKKLSATTQE